MRFLLAAVAVWMAILTRASGEKLLTTTTPSECSLREPNRAFIDQQALPNVW